MFKAGMTFTHERFLQPGWEPGPGEKHIDAPKAEMLITKVTQDTIYYRYAGSNRARLGNAAFKMDRQRFSEIYWGSVEEHLKRRGSR